MRDVICWTSVVSAAVLAMLFPAFRSSPASPFAAPASAAIPVPEPATLILLGVGLIGLAVLGFFRHRRKPPRRPETGSPSPEL